MSLAGDRGLTLEALLDRQFLSNCHPLQLERLLEFGTLADPASENNLPSLRANQRLSVLFTVEKEKSLANGRLIRWNIADRMDLTVAVLQVQKGIL